MAIHKRVKIFFLVLVIWTSLYVIHKNSEIHVDKNTEESVKIHLTCGRGNHAIQFHHTGLMKT